MENRFSLGRTGNSTAALSAGEANVRDFGTQRKSARTNPTIIGAGRPAGGLNDGTLFSLAAGGCILKE